MSQKTRPIEMTEEDAAIRAMEEMEEDDESVDTMGVSDEIVIRTKPSWSDKYRPRKPRYFNRVKTGYDLNKYNQTHYDHDNPPKVVQGYKFNLFYQQVPHVII